VVVVVVAVVILMVVVVVVVVVEEEMEEKEPKFVVEYGCWSGRVSLSARAEVEGWKPGKATRVD
jgi:hypothetical protein